LADIAARDVFVNEGSHAGPPVKSTDKFTIPSGMSG
jgi:hypothetical protein